MVSIVAQVDTTARTIAMVGLALAAISTAASVIALWRSRHRVLVTLTQGMHASAEEQFDIAIVTVRSIGRPMAVEQINVKPVEQRVDRISTTPVDLGVGALPMGIGAPWLPYTLADGEARQWAFRLSRENLSGQVQVANPWVPVRATVALANGKRVTSNESHLRLYSLPPPTRAG